MTSRRVLVTLVALLALLAAACGNGDDPAVSDSSTTTATAADSDDHATFAFGEPADAATADRVVEIEMNDEFRFVPDEIEISEGETITFRVHNAGKILHDFTIGDANTQDAHEDEMAEMTPHMMGTDGDVNATVVEPGATKDLTWRFTEAHDLLFGCHVPGHYAAGMVGTFTPAG